MNEEDRFSASSAESERDNDRDETMADADEAGNDADPDAEPEEDNNEDDEDDEADNAPDPDDPSANASNGRAVKSPRQKSSTPTPTLTLPCRPVARPEALSARLYDIVPTMAAPQSTSINAMAITPDLRYWITGGSDGYIRKYDGPGTINGKLALTVAQKHPFVDSVTKAGILMSYWENEEPAASGRGDQDHALSPVYSLAVQSDALWLLSGLDSGAISLQSVRHDEGKKICNLQKHVNAVSVLTLAQDEKSVLSGSWDKSIFDWDLNTGQTKRSFDGSGGQISAIEMRPASGDPIPAEADELPPSHTMSTNNKAPIFGISATPLAAIGTEPDARHDDTSLEGPDDQASPAHESLFGGSDAGSLFGETTGEQPFGRDDDEFSTTMDMMPGHEGGMDHSADMAMAGMEMSRDLEKDSALPAQLQIQPTTGGQGAAELDDAASALAEAPSQPHGSVADRSPPFARQHEESFQQPNQEQQHPPAPSPPSGTPPDFPGPHSKSKSPSLVGQQPPRTQYDPSQTSSTTFLSSAMDGTIRIWDRRVPNAVARIGNRAGVPPWCMSACWSPDGNMIYAGRRNGTVEEFDVRRASSTWDPERVLKFPGGSGAVSAVRPMVNGRHLVCASHDILRLYDLRDTRAFKHSTVPFLIIPGPPRAGVISSLYIDPTCRFMLSAAGTRGWEGTSTEVLIGYEINVSSG